MSLVTLDSNLSPNPHALETIQTRVGEPSNPQAKDSESLPLQTLVQEQQTALETMDHLFDALSEPNRAMQDEHAKMASAFQRFMEKAEKQMEAQSQQIANLQEELAKERAYSTEVLKSNQALMQKVEQLTTEVRAHIAAQNQQNLTQQQVNAAMSNRQANLESRHANHVHNYHFENRNGDGFNWNTKGPNC